MSVFWKTKFSIEPGFGMESYSLGHFFWLAVLVVLILFLGKKYKNCDESGRQKMRLTIAFLTIADELSKYILTLPTGQWDWNFLPFHLCSISMFAVLIHSITGNKYLEEYLYAVGLPAATMAMVFPDWTGQLPFFNLMCIHSFTIHMLLVIYPCLLIAGGFKPDIRKLVVVLFAVLLLAIVMYFVNNILDTNFFFVNGGGDGANPLSILEGYVGRWYLLAIPLIGTICWLPMYIIPNRFAKRAR